MTRDAMTGIGMAPNDMMQRSTMNDRAMSGSTASSSTTSRSTTSNSTAQSLLSRLQQRAEQAPTAALYTHLTFDGQPPQISSNADVWQGAQAVAAALTAQGLQGRPLLLLYAAGPEFAPAFFGTLMAGAIAVPVPVPQFAAQYERMERIMADCDAAAILSTTELHLKLLPKLTPASALRTCVWICSDQLPAATFAVHDDAAAALALLQYTSGSTSEPKGVALTRDNLAHNLDLLVQAFAPPPAARIVSWLPHFHDMGLVTGIMAPLATGGDAVLMSPLAFLQRPLRWLQAVSDYRGVISGAPNFAYELCVKAAQRGTRPALDLTSWRSAFAGAEPVRMATLDVFAACFAQDGFQYGALTPCYGMAEATLIVTCKPAAAAPSTQVLSRTALQEGRAEPAPDQSSAVRLVGCGMAVGSTDLRIVDPQRRVQLAAGQVGEAWIRGPQVARGYWRSPADDPFAGQLADSGEGPFLRSGDLGYLTEQGEFVFVDRLKDLVIVNGQNHACHDLEFTAGNSHPLLAPTACAAIAIDTAERAVLLIVAEVPAAAQDSAAAIATAVRGALFSTHGLPVQTIALVPPRKLSRTTSGKLQRRLTAQRLLDGSLAALACIGEPLPQLHSNNPTDNPTDRHNA